MAKTVPAGLNTHIQGEVTTLATLWKVTRQDGQEFTFTDHDVDITQGGDLYLSTYGYRRSSMPSGAQLGVDTVDLAAILATGEVETADLQAGLFDYAQFEVKLVNWADVSDGVVTLRKGWLGECKIPGDGTFRAELRGLTQALTRVIGEIATPTCRADLGDSRCKINLTPPTWEATTPYATRDQYDATTEQESPSGSVAPTTPNDRHYIATSGGTSGGSEPSPWETTIGQPQTDGGVTWECVRARSITATVNQVQDRRIFTITATTDAPDYWFTGGLCTFTSGANNGVTLEIKDWDLSGGALGDNQITLFLKAPFTVAQTDAVLLRAGCDKRPFICQNRFSNLWNIRADPFVPGRDLAFETPDAV